MVNVFLTQIIVVNVFYVRFQCAASDLLTTLYFTMWTIHKQQCIFATMFAEDEIVGPVRKLARHNKTVFLFEKNKKKHQQTIVCLYSAKKVADKTRQWNEINASNKCECAALCVKAAHEYWV